MPVTPRLYLASLPVRRCRLCQTDLGNHLRSVARYRPAAHNSDMTTRDMPLGYLLIFGVLWFGVAQSSPAQRPPGGDPVLGERIAKGIAFAGRLWILGTMPTPREASGGLVSFGMTDNNRVVHFEGGVLDIAKSDHDLWILRKGAKKQGFVVAVWRGNRFEDFSEFQLAPQDRPLALLRNAGWPAVLSVETVHYLSDDKSWSVVQLKGKLRSGVEVSVASPEEGGTIYVGFDVGEWGGGLQEVDLKTGTVSNIERRHTKVACDGPLNRECDPVTGVIPDPRTKDCVLASIGLVHLGMSNGRILRVCGSRVTLVSEILMPSDKSSDMKWGRTEAFYGLASSSEGGFWAITHRALYHYDVNGNKEKEYPLPKLESVSGIHMSKALPGVVVLQTDVNWAVSTSGYTPLVVPLEAPRAP